MNASLTFTLSLCMLQFTAPALAQASRSQPQATAADATPSTARPPTAQPPLPTTKLTIGLHLVTAEVAKDHHSRQMGLMFRNQLAPNHGMVFVFDNRHMQCMWMRNTLIPLSVAFIDDEGLIVNIENMQPRDEKTRHCSRQPVRYALEMTRGWFAERKIGPGEVIRGLPRFQ